MIANEMVHEVKRLLANTSLSHRKIAAMTGVSRTSVGTIAQGRRPDYEALRREREAEQDEPIGPRERCARCGATVYMPCRLCRTRDLMAQSRLGSRPVIAELPVAIELVGEQRARYEEIHAQREREAAAA